ncbi:MAG: M48 family metallopeptidase [Candidatus Kapaibacteriota bacterium]
MENIEVSYNNKIYPVEIEYKKVRHIRLMIYPEIRLRLISPNKHSLKYLAEFVKSKQKWLEKHIDKFEKRKEIESKFQETQFKFLGKAYEKKIIQSNNVYSEILGSQFIIYSNEENNKELQLLIEKKFLLSKAPEIIEPIIDKYLILLKPYGISLKEVKYRYLKTQWGNCIKSKKKITLNIKLIHEDIKFIEYVILHELCHLKYANHSKQFYDFLSIFMPDWKESKRLIKK